MKILQYYALFMHQGVAFALLVQTKRPHPYRDIQASAKLLVVAPLPESVEIFKDKFEIFSETKGAVDEDNVVRWLRAGMPKEGWTWEAAQ